MRYLYFVVAVAVMVVISKGASVFIPDMVPIREFRVILADALMPLFLTSIAGLLMIHSSKFRQTTLLFTALCSFVTLEAAVLVHHTAPMPSTIVSWVAIMVFAIPIVLVCWEITDPKYNSDLAY